MFSLVLFVVWLPAVSRAQSWTLDDLALFDLVEELEQENFYSIFRVNQDAPTKEIKRAYRRLSLEWHPDKNPDPNAATRFRQIAAVYEILKNDESRRKYDDVLEFGLPDWRQPIYYYRQVRKMPWWETALLILVLFTLCHYLMLWGAYFEGKLNLQSHFDRLRKKEKKLRKQNIDVDQLVEDYLEEKLRRPRPSQLLPFLLARFSVDCARAGGKAVWVFFRPPPPETPREAPALPRPPPVYLEPVSYEIARNNRAVSYTAASGAGQDTEETPLPTASPSGAEWKLDEITHLIRLTNKFPVGTPNRWEQIASTLQRKPEQVTKMIGRLKKMDPHEYQRLCRLANESPQSSVHPLPPDGGRSGEKEESSEEESPWSETQQRHFEAALQEFPKGTPERWDRVAEKVPGKSKSDCMLRFKQLALMVRQRKANAAS